MAWGIGDWLLAAGATAAGGAGVYVGARMLRTRASAPATSTSAPAGSAPGPTGRTGGTASGLPAGLPAHPTPGQSITLNGQCWQYGPGVAPWTSAQIAAWQGRWQASLAQAKAGAPGEVLLWYETNGTPQQLAATAARLAAGVPAAWQHCSVAIPA